MSRPPLDALVHELAAGRGVAPTGLSAAHQLRLSTQIPRRFEVGVRVCQALRATPKKTSSSSRAAPVWRSFASYKNFLRTWTYSWSPVTATNDTETKLRAGCEAARSAVGGELTGVLGGGEVGSMHRGAYLHPPLNQRPQPGSVISDPSQVLLEFGQSAVRTALPADRQLDAYPASWKTPASLSPTTPT